MIRSFLRSWRVVALSYVVAAVAVCLQTWWTVEQDHRLTIESEAANGIVIVRLLEEHAARTLKDAEQALDVVAATIHDLSQVSPQAKSAARKGMAPASGGASSEVAGSDQEPAIRTAVASYDLTRSQYLKAMQFVSLDGLSWITSPDYPAHQVDVSDRSHIKLLLAQGTRRDVVVGHPYSSPYDNQLVIPVARNVFGAQDKAVGIISVDIRVAYFGSVYARVARENNAAVAQIADDGFVIVRSPFEARFVDRDISAEQAFVNMRKSPMEGRLTDATFLDDEMTRMYIYRKVANFPSTIVYGRDIDTILARWHGRTRDRLLFAATMLVLGAVLSWFLAFHIRGLQRSRAQVRESESRFIGLFQRSPVALVLLRKSDLRSTEVNDAWLDLLGFTRDEAVGRTSAELNMVVDESDTADTYRRLHQLGRAEHIDVRRRHKDGRILTCSMSIQDFSIKEEDLVIVSLVDVTRQRAAEAEVRALNLELEQRVLARTDNLARANTELAEALAALKRMQSEVIRSEKMSALGSMVAGIAHELNTPIGNSLTVASTLHANTADMQKTVASGSMRRSALDEYLRGMSHGNDILMRALTRAAELISSFKRVAVDQSSDVRRVFDLKTVVQEVCISLEPMFRNKGFHLEVDIPAGIEMDGFPGPLGQVVTNLVSNAVQHGFEGRDHGVMRVMAQASDGNAVLITFSDDGVGMSAETQKRVFDPFFTTKLGKGGSGLGMHILYNIVTSVLEGQVDVQSAPGAGMTVRIVLPLKVSSARAAAG